MVLWFTGTAMIAMWFTFRDPAIDHRFVIVGALIPEVVGAFSAQASFTHNLFIPIVLMGVLMLLTIGRRQIRRKGIAIPIGMFWHLIFVRTQSELVPMVSMLLNFLLTTK